MPNDTELRELFQGADGPASSIDPGAIIRRSKRRRLPRQVGAGGVLTLAAAGIGIAGVTGVGGLNILGARTAGDLVESAADAPGWVGTNSSGADEGPSAPYAAGDGAMYCGSEEARPGINPWQLGMDVTVTRDPARGDPVGTAAVTIRNNGSAAVEVSPIGPVVHTLQRDGVVVAIGSGVLVGVGTTLHTGSLRLEAAQSVTLQSRFTLSSCLPEQTGVRPGSYLLGTQLSFESDTGADATVDGPLTAITVR